MTTGTGIIHQDSNRSHGQPVATTGPQHQSSNEDWDDGSISCGSLDSKPLSVSGSASEGGTIQPPTHVTRIVEVSLDDVMKELSELRVSAKNQALSRDIWRDESENNRSVGTLATVPTEEDEEAMAKFSSGLTFRPPVSFQTTDDALKRLEKALDVQQVILYERQASILQLRMTIVKTMMDFEATSKQIRNAYLSSQGTITDDRLTASWPELPLSDSSEREMLDSSWPFLNPALHSMNASFFDDQEFLSLDIHTIVEEGSGESLSDTGGSTSQYGSSNRSSSSSPSSSRQILSPNKEPYVSLVHRLEPECGRLQASRSPGAPSPLSQTEKRRSSLERVEDALQSSDDVPRTTAFWSLGFDLVGSGRMPSFVEEASMSHSALERIFDDLD